MRRYSYSIKHREKIPAGDVGTIALIVIIAALCLICLV